MRLFWDLEARLAREMRERVKAAMSEDAFTTA